MSPLPSGFISWKMKVLGLVLFFISVSMAQPAPISQTITVDIHGGGQFTSIQEAINSIPPNNQQWVHIYVRPGSYMETVRVDRQYIFMEGESSSHSIIDFSLYGTPQGSKTIEIVADNFVAKNMGFKNNHNYPAAIDNNGRVQAVAATVSGDKVAFYNCGFMGVQDTLWDKAGRHYFQSCYISGCVDFIFGAGQSHYENCTLAYNGPSHGVDKGYITAQGRESAQDTNGFVFLNCKMIGTGLTYLGRAWRPFARVLFYQSELTEIVVPQGWAAFYGTGHEDEITFAEDRCYGKGSDTSQRVPWEKKLSDYELTLLTSRSFVDAEAWIEQQP